MLRLVLRLLNTGAADRASLSDSTTAAPMSSSVLLSSLTNALSSLLTSCTQLDTVISIMTAALEAQAGDADATAQSTNTAASSNDGTIAATLQRAQQGAPVTTSVHQAAQGEAIPAKSNGALASGSSIVSTDGVRVALSSSSLNAITSVPSGASVDTNEGWTQQSTQDTLLVTLSSQWSACKASEVVAAGVSTSAVPAPIVSIQLTVVAKPSIASAIQADQQQGKTTMRRRLLGTASPTAAPVITVNVPVDPNVLLDAVIIQAAPATCYVNAASFGQPALACAYWDTTSLLWSSNGCVTGAPLSDLTVPCSCSMPVGSNAAGSAATQFSLLYTPPQLVQSCFDVNALAQHFITAAGGNIYGVNFAIILGSQTLSTYYTTSGSGGVSGPANYWWTIPGGGDGGIVYPSTSASFIHLPFTSSTTPGTLLPLNSYVDATVITPMNSQYFQLPVISTGAFVWLYVVSNANNLPYIITNGGATINGASASWTSAVGSSGCTCAANAAGTGWLCSEGVLNTPSPSNSASSTASVTAALDSLHDQVTTSYAPGTLLPADSYIDLYVALGTGQQHAQLGYVSGMNAFTWIYVVSNPSNLPWTLTGPSSQTINGVAGSYQVPADVTGLTCMAAEGAAGWQCTDEVAGTTSFPSGGSETVNVTHIDVSENSPTVVQNVNSYISLDFSNIPNTTSTVQHVQLPPVSPNSYVWLYSAGNTGVPWEVDPSGGDTINYETSFTPSVGTSGVTCSADPDNAVVWLCVNGVVPAPNNNNTALLTQAPPVFNTTSISNGSTSAGPEYWPYLFLAVLYAAVCITTAILAVAVGSEAHHCTHR